MTLQRDIALLTSLNDSYCVIQISHFLQARKLNKLFITFYHFLIIS